REQRAQPSGTLRRAERMKRGEAALREVSARNVERAAQGLAPADRDHFGARVEGVQPLGRGGEAGADDRHALRVLVRLVGVDDTPVVAQLGRHVEARVPKRQKDVAEDAVAVELEAAVDGAHTLDAPQAKALVPTASFT